MINKQPTMNPLRISLPDGHIIASDKNCVLDIPQLPAIAQIAHIVPGLPNSSLISFEQYSDMGCRVESHDPNCYVYLDIKIILKRPRKKITMDITSLNSSNAHSIKSQKNFEFPTNRNSKNFKLDLATLTFGEDKIGESISDIMHMSTQQELIKFFHQCLFSPTASIWITPINNHHFTGWPGLTATAVQQHLCVSTATIKGHAMQPQNMCPQQTNHTRKIIVFKHCFQG